MSPHDYTSGILAVPQRRDFRFLSVYELWHTVEANDAHKLMLCEDVKKLYWA